MSDELKDILDAASKLGEAVARHPAVAKYQAAQKSLADDPEASRLMAEFGKQVENFSRLEQSGMPLSDSQRTQLEALQTRIASHIKVKSLNIAEVDFTDMLRKVSQAWQKPLASATGGSSASSGGQRAMR